MLSATAHRNSSSRSTGDGTIPTSSFTGRQTTSTASSIAVAAAVSAVKQKGSRSSSSTNTSSGQNHIHNSRSNTKNRNRNGSNHDADVDVDVEEEDDDTHSVYSTTSTIGTTVGEEALYEKLCFALYHPKYNNNNSGRNSNKNKKKHKKKKRGIWWPALQFSSFAEFMEYKGDDYRTLLQNMDDRKQAVRATKLIAQRTLLEAVRLEPIETIMYLGRPVDEYVTAEDAEKRGIEIQEFTTGLGTLHKRMRKSNNKEGSLRPDFVSKFLPPSSSPSSSASGTGAVDEEDRQGRNAKAFEVFQSYYEGLDLIQSLTRIDDDDEDDSSNDGDDDGNKSTFTKEDEIFYWRNRMQEDWDRSHQFHDYYQSRGSSSNNSSSGGARGGDNDDAEQNSVVLAMGQRQQEQQDQDEEEEYDYHRHHRGDGIDAEEEDAHSTAAVSLYTEGSLMSASNANHNSTSKRSSKSAVALPQKLPNVNHNDIVSDFDTIWNKHLLEGWDGPLYVNGRYVYHAVNGYAFDSKETLCRYLTETYGWQDPNPPPSSASSSARSLSYASSSSVRGRSRDGRRRSQSPPSSPAPLVAVDDRRTKRQRSISPDGKRRWSTLWKYLTVTLGWTYDYASMKDTKDFGASTIWLRKGFTKKRRGKFGQDHFYTEDDVVTYCDKKAIYPPGSRTDRQDEEEVDDGDYNNYHKASVVRKKNKTKKSTSTRNHINRYPIGTRILKNFSGRWYTGEVISYNKKRQLYDVKYDDGDTEEFNAADMKEWSKVDDDDDDDESGYTTPDDQSTVPQDPGKPRVPSPSEATNATTYSSGNSKGTRYSISSQYDDDDRYDFKKLWSRLKGKGWYWARPKNQFDDYWYIRPASIRPESEWIHGTDYFCTQDEVVAFVKERDNALSSDKISRSDDEIEDAPLKKMKDKKKKTKKEKKKSISKKKMEKKKVGKKGAPCHSFNDNLNTNGKDSNASGPTIGKENDRTGVDTFGTNKDGGPPNKKKKTGKKKNSQKVESTEFEMNGSNNESNLSAATKRRKDADSSNSNDNKGKSKKKQKGTPVIQSESTKIDVANLLKDESLKLKIGRDETPPWVVKKPRIDHVMCLKGSAVTYFGGYYYLPGEDRKRFTSKFSNLGELAKHFARTNEYSLSPSGSMESENNYERSLSRFVQYAMVPGKLSMWDNIRRINRSETSYLLCKLGYRRTHGDYWEPPNTFVVGKILKPKYGSLDLLCDALKCLDDLHVPPGSASRRRKHDSSLSELQLIALRLRIAEGFVEFDKEYDANYENSTDKSMKVPPLPSAVSRGIKCVASGESARIRDNNDIQNDKSKKRKRTSKEISNDDKQSEEIEAQVALSPSQIKVGKFKKNPKDNNAPWAIIDPAHLPVSGSTWHNFYLKTGCSWSGGYYYLPGESLNDHNVRFTSTNAIQPHVCEGGDYSVYLKPFNEVERMSLKRYFDYGLVPGAPSEWKQIRRLKLFEVVLFLNLLGFQKENDRRWSVPEGLPILDPNKRYRSLPDLGKALVRVPDLEDRTRGMLIRRRARKGERIISEKQMMALRLRIAEGLENEDGYEPPTDDVEMDIVSENISNEKKKKVSSVADSIISNAGTTSTEKKRDTSNVVNASDPSKGPRSNQKKSKKSKVSSTCARSSPRGNNMKTMTDQDVLDLYRNDICDHTTAWGYLRNLGCIYKGSTYHLPGQSKSSIECQNDLVEYIVEHSVSVLDWKNCTLESSEVEHLVTYLKGFQSRTCLKESNLVVEAFRKINRNNVNKFLKKIGIHWVGGVKPYKIGDENHEESVVVNRIRSTGDIYSLCENEMTPSKRRRSNDPNTLSQLESLVLRMWAIKSNVALTNMPALSTIGIGSSTANEHDHDKANAVHEGAVKLVETTQETKQQQLPQPALNFMKTPPPPKGSNTNYGMCIATKTPVIYQNASSSLTTDNDDMKARSGGDESMVPANTEEKEKEDYLEFLTPIESLEESIEDYDTDAIGLFTQPPDDDDDNVNEAAMDLDNSNNANTRRVVANQTWNDSNGILDMSEPATMDIHTPTPGHSNNVEPRNRTPLFTQPHDDTFDTFDMDDFNS